MQFYVVPRTSLVVLEVPCRPNAGALADARGVPGVRPPRGVSLRFVGVLDLAVRVRPKRRG